MMGRGGRTHRRQVELQVLLEVGGGRDLKREERGVGVGGGEEGASAVPSEHADVDHRARPQLLDHREEKSQVVRLGGGHMAVTRRLHGGYTAVTCTPGWDLSLIHI